MPQIRQLVPADAFATEQFLATRADTTLFLRNNLELAGLVDGDRPYQGFWVGAWQGPQLLAVAAHFWNGNLILEAPVSLAEVAVAAVKGSGRSLNGIVASWAQAVGARTALGMDGAAMRLFSRQRLYSLDLGKLRVPAQLADPAYCVREPLEAELELLVKWRMAYIGETKSMAQTPKLEQIVREGMQRSQAERRHWVLARGPDPVAYSAFNAVRVDVVQVGGVWTPPPLRSRGYGRSVVAGTLRLARERGVTRSVLFTDQDNAAASRAYEALGYQEVGDYGILGFAESPPAR